MPEGFQGFQGLQSLNGLVRAERASTAVDTPREVVTRRGLEQAAREEFARRRQTAGFPTAISMDPDFTGAGQMPRQQAEGVLGTIKDFSPVADLEDIVQAVQDPTPLNVGVAGLAALGPVGDAAKKALRARKVVPNKAERKAAAEMTETELQQIVVGKGPVGEVVPETAKKLSHGAQWKIDDTMADIGEVGNKRHITRVEKGTAPTDVVASYSGAKGEVRGEHRNRLGARWQEFLEDIKENGIKEKIFITVDHNDRPVISVGNHRIEAAGELGLESVPVEIRYFGHSEKQGVLGTRGIYGEPAPKQERRKVYTGSPHKYAPEPGYPMGRPRDEFIGTGEGGAFRGYGHYATESPVVGRKYQHMLSGNVDVDLLEEYFKPGNIVPSYGGHDRVIEFVKEKAPDINPQGEFDDWKGVWVQAVEKKGNEWVDILGKKPRFHRTTPSAQSIKKVTGKSLGYMYEQALKVADEDFLLWDKPLAEQSEKVQEALKPLLDFWREKGTSEAALKSWRGEQLYESTSIEDWGTPVSFAHREGFTGKRKDEVSSNYLKSIGIRGIKFLDQWSRAAGKGTHNFVVFDPNDLEILRVLGIAGAAVGLSQIPEPRQ